ncbi:MAG: site-2 protease family protein [Planctomycetota bacterium]|jgi:Zn-dependent protease
MAEDLLPLDSSNQQKAYTCDEILAEIERQQSEKKSWLKNLFILLISLFIFFRLGLFESGVSDLVIIIVVLLIHEAGHFIGMRLFGYRNVQMFFIPLFGAAVSGQSRNVPAYKKALVALLGPVPGIVLGIVSAIAYAVTKNPIFRRFMIMFLLIKIFRRFMIMFLLINTFNLLPFFPLDGGRFLHEVLFSRNRYVELCFTILASLALIGLGLLMKAWLLAVFGLFTLVGAQFPFKVASIANQVRPRLSDAAPPFRRRLCTT